MEYEVKILEIIPKKIGILSIDIDGNDYWILNRIIKNASVFPKGLKIS